MAGESSLPPWIWPRAVYIHVPFCAHHCCYCDFAVVAGQDHSADRYLDALEQEIEQLGTPQPVDTLFIGGGTPTHLRPKQLDRLLNCVLKWLPPKSGHEFSVEANPSGLDEEKINVLVEHGVNRISLGVQSFQPHLLKFLERDHTPDDVARSIGEIRKLMANLSVDLIFGIPGQTPQQWHDDLRTALRLGVSHISTYGLTYEKGTRLWKERQRGGVRPLSEDSELEMYLMAMDVLEAAGFEQYEISSFAARNFRCRHNQVYWANHAYFGFGMGAARYVRARRETNTRDLHTFLRRIFAGESAVFQSEELPPQERARETMALNLRRTEGIQRGDFAAQTEFSIDALSGRAIAHHCDEGFLADTGEAIRLTCKGRCVADKVIQDFL